MVKFQSIICSAFSTYVHYEKSKGYLHICKQKSMNKTETYDYLTLVMGESLEP